LSSLGSQARGRSRRCGLSAHVRQGNIPTGERYQDGNSPLMPRLPEVDPDRSPPVRDAYERIMATRGVVSNVMRALAHAPDGLRKFSELGEYVRYGTELTDLQREIVILTVGRAIPYAWAHHSVLGRQAGLTDGQLDAIKEGRQLEGLASAESALADFARSFASFGGVPDPVFGRLAASFSPRQITDAALLAAYYIGLGAVIIGLDVPPDPPAAVSQGAAAAQARHAR